MWREVGRRATIRGVASSLPCRGVLGARLALPSTGKAVGAPVANRLSACSISTPAQTRFFSLTPNNNSNNNTSLAPPSSLSKPDPDLVEGLRAIQEKVIWLATYTVHHANNLRPKRDGLKVYFLNNSIVFWSLCQPWIVALT